MNRFLKQFSTLFKNELLLVSRNHESVISLGFFSFLVILIFQFAFRAELSAVIPLICPMVWLATLFGGILRMNRTFEPEAPGEVLSALRLIPNIAVPFFLCKFIINLIFLVVLEAMILFLVVFLFNVPAPLAYVQKGALPLFLGVFGFACVGTTFSSMLISHKRKDLILPVILYPILVPLVVGVIKSFTYSVSGDLMGLEAVWIKILVIFDLVYLVLSLLVFETLMETG